jgi:hypothetical protein
VSKHGLPSRAPTFIQCTQIPAAIDFLKARPRQHIRLTATLLQAFQHLTLGTQA